MTIIQFPTPEGTPRLRLVQDQIGREIADFQLDLIIEAADAFAVVSGELANAARRIRCCGAIAQTDAVLCGETLHSILLGLKPAIELAGQSNNTRELWHVAERLIRTIEEEKS